MPALKPISGHSSSVRPIIGYLTRKERALAADYLNCEEVDALGRETWRQMDDARHALGCDVAVGGHSRVRTYEHFVLSPDPRDNVDLDTLRALSVEWAEELFGSFQVAIYYHDDNERRIPHAHVVVNNANLDRPGRVSTMLTPSFEARAFRLLQELAASMGLHAFTPEATSENHAEWARADAARHAPERPKQTRRPARVDRAEAEAAGRGASWKRDVRDRLALAVALSTGEGEFVECCRALGLGVEESRGKRGAGEWVYAHPGGDAWRVRGSTLGADWSRWGVQRRLARDRQSGVAKPDAAGRERLLASVSALEAPGPGTRMGVLGTARGAAVTAEGVASMLAVCGELDVRSMADFTSALREPMPPEKRDEVRAAMETARALGHLPGRRDRVDGERSTYEERRRLARAGRTRHATRKATEHPAPAQDAATQPGVRAPGAVRSGDAR